MFSCWPFQLFNDNDCVNITFIILEIPFKIFYTMLSHCVFTILPSPGIVFPQKARSSANADFSLKFIMCCSQLIFHLNICPFDCLAVCHYHLLLHVLIRSCRLLTTFYELASKQPKVALSQSQQQNIYMHAYMCAYVYV